MATPEVPPEEPDEITEHDTEPSNLLFRAGYLRALAETAKDDDRLWLLRASRSLRAFASTRNGDVAVVLREGSPGSGRYA